MLGIALLGAVLLAPVFRVLVWFFGPQPVAGPYALPFCRMDALAAGALVSLALKCGHIEKIRMLAHATPIAAVLAIGGLLVWTRADLPFVAVGYSLTIIASTAVLARLLISRESAWLRRLFSNAAMVYVGRISYGLYLLHLIARAVVDRCLPSWQGFDPRYDLPACLLRFGCITALAVLMATVSYYLFESPILRLKDRWAPAGEKRVATMA
jgi:peptidoglycan/LPS O-acetylase OafA/YrhL